MITLSKKTWLSNADGYFLDRPQGKPIHGIAINGQHPGEIKQPDCTPAEYKLALLQPDALKQVYEGVKMGGRAKELRESEIGDKLQVA